jgi:hypothetical protein
MSGGQASVKSRGWPAVIASTAVLLPLTDAAIYGHLAGDHTIGLYALVGDDRCHLLAVDFDDQDWCDDARAFLHSCRELTVPAALEALPPDAPRIVRATGRLVGEGFDHPPLVTLLLPCPCRGRARCSNTPAACTGNKLAKPAYGRSTGSIAAILCRNTCGSGDCGAIGRWGIR